MEKLIQLLDDLDDLWQRAPVLLLSSHARTLLATGAVTLCIGVGTLITILH